MSPQYGELRPTSGWDRFGCLGHRFKFQRVRDLAALLHGTLVVGVSQALRRWTEGATYIRQGGHHVGHWPTFLVLHVDTMSLHSCSTRNDVKQGQILKAEAEAKRLRSMLVPRSECWFWGGGRDQKSEDKVTRPTTKPKFSRQLRIFIVS